MNLDRCYKYFVRCTNGDEYTADDLIQELRIGLLENRRGWNQKDDESDDEYSLRLCRMTFANYRRNKENKNLPVERLLDPKSISDFGVSINEKNKYLDDLYIQKAKVLVEYFKDYESFNYVIKHHILSSNVLYDSGFELTAIELDLKESTVKKYYQIFLREVKENIDKIVKDGMNVRSFLKGSWYHKKFL